MSELESKGELMGKMMALCTIDDLKVMGKVSDELKQGMMGLNPTFIEKRLGGFVR